MLHQQLTAVLFILRASQIRRAVWTWNNDDAFAPACRLRPHGLRNRVLLPGKLEKYHVVEMRRVGSMHVVVEY